MARTFRRTWLAPFVAAALAAGCDSGPSGNGVFNPSAESAGAGTEKAGVRSDLPVPEAPTPDPAVSAVGSGEATDAGTGGRGDSGATPPADPSPADGTVPATPPKVEAPSP
jgi:hypothetical protein